MKNWSRAACPEDGQVSQVQGQQTDALLHTALSENLEGLKISSEEFMFRILRGASKIVSILWIYHLIHGIKKFCFKHLLNLLPPHHVHAFGGMKTRKPDCCQEEK